MTCTSFRRLGQVPFLVGVLLSGAPLARAATVPGDAALGRSLYEAKCGGCHALDANRIGPMHRGVVGRRPGSVANFDYSPAVRKLGGVWTPARLDQWLQGPQALAPGARMYFSVADPPQRRNIIAYLASVSPPLKSAPHSPGS